MTMITMPTKKINKRQIAVLMALGTFSQDLPVSPAATPINSVPEKAKFTINMVVKIGNRPCGNQPSSVKLLNNGAEVCP